MRIAVIGASGFVGRSLIARLLAEGSSPLRINRRDDRPNGAAPMRIVADDAGDDAMRAALAGIDGAIHLIARVHQMHEQPARDGKGTLDGRYRAVNCDLALRWARAARAAGVGRFVFVSSVKAVAERSVQPLDEGVEPAPQDAYGRSKLAAENDLMQATDLACLERVVVRPPLVYGPRVGANFLQLMRLAASPLPLPLGAATAPRTMIAVDNLADALLACVRSPRAPGATYFVGDGRDVSVAWLIGELRRLQGRPPRLIRIPGALLRGLALPFGRGAAIDRLFEPLQLDCSRIRSELGWSPSRTVEAALAEAFAWFRAASR